MNNPVNIPLSFFDFPDGSLANAASLMDRHPPEQVNELCALVLGWKMHRLEIGDGMVRYAWTNPPHIDIDGRIRVVDVPDFHGSIDACRWLVQWARNNPSECHGFLTRIRDCDGLTMAGNPYMASVVSTFFLSCVCRARNKEGPPELRAKTAHLFAKPTHPVVKNPQDASAPSDAATSDPNSSTKED